jgi:DNA polymerase-3 subunit alpha
MSPVKYTDRERLTWERELMGLYVSAHPLDNYDAYFEEQTIPITKVLPEIDGKKVTLGGLILAVRTIVTKNGTKMAFVKIEDKTGEGEIIVFPNLYEQIGAKLVQDAVVKATGKISARDRDGNVGSDAKLIADEIQFITDQELNSYKKTGRKMEGPKAGGYRVKAMRVTSAKKTNTVTSAPIIKPINDKVIKKVYVHIKDPDDHEMLLSLKQTCSLFPGLYEVILVLGADKKSAIKMPFKVDVNDTIIGNLVKILGEDSVAVK